jgi:hypothetical protein
VRGRALSLCGFRLASADGVVLCCMCQRPARANRSIVSYQSHAGPYLASARCSYHWTGGGVPAGTLPVRACALAMASRAGGQPEPCNDCDMMAGKLCAASGQWQRTRTDNDAERCLALWFRGRGSGREML